jgi:exopolysaccharide production protein ExoZ
LPGLQVLRGIAASLVVLHHFAGIYKDGIPGHSWIYASGLGNLGRCGVDIFFVISGFIMVYTTGRKAGADDALIFIRRRILRIYPLYWIWTSVLLALWLGGAVEQLRHYSTGYLIRSYLLIPAFNGTYFEPLLQPGWTLSFEMLFYVVFSCGVLLKLRSGKILFLAAAFSLMALLARFLAPDSGMRYLLTNPIIVEFLFGVLIAEMLIRLPAMRGNRFSRFLPGALVSGGAFALLCTVKIPNADSMRFALYGIPAFFVVLGAAMLGPAAAPKFLVHLGDASYSIYLAHFFLAQAYASALKHLPIFNGLPPDAAILLAGAATIAISSATYALMEKPLTQALAFRTSTKPVNVASAPLLGAGEGST